MDARFVIMMMMGVLLMGWVVFCGIQFIRHSRNLVAGASFTGHVKCEKCGTEYEVSAAEFTESYASKSRTVTKTKLRGAALVNRPEYRYFAKKFYCPSCRRKRYAQVLNINEIQDVMLKPSLKAGARWLIIMCVGGIIILAVASIPMHFAEKAAQQQVEELKQQRYEEFVERYM
ncbi:hypothetical protein [Gallibacter sp. Marseille-QA0791]|uniref:hypothetical protein n=1 Tax=Gallibacter sp. Marseille-QA0791 TaxID=3378781 RepID=UPI003D0DB9F3